MHVDLSTSCVLGSNGGDQTNLLAVVRRETKVEIAER